MNPAMTLSPTALEEAARAALLVRARLPGCQDEWHVLSTDPDFDDLPANGDEGCDDDEITQEAVLRVCTAAITAYLAQAGKEGWVLVPNSALAWLFGEGPDADGHWFEPPEIKEGERKKPYWWRSKFRAMLAAAQNGGEPCT